ELRPDVQPGVFQALRDERGGGVALALAAGVADGEMRAARLGEIPLGVELALEAGEHGVELRAAGADGACAVQRLDRGGTVAELAMGARQCRQRRRILGAERRGAFEQVAPGGVLSLAHARDAEAA